MKHLLCDPELQNQPIQIDLYFGCWEKPPEAFITANARLLSLSGRLETFKNEKYNRWHFPSIEKAIEGAGIIQKTIGEYETTLPHRLVCLAHNMRYMQVGDFPNV